MAIIEILLPKMGESVAEATIIKFLVDAGANVEADQAVVEIATDKVDSEVPAPEDGVLVEWLVSEDDVVQVGDPIARYEIGGEATSSASASVSSPAPKSEPSPVPSQDVVEMVSAPLAAAVVVTSPERTGKSGRFYSPLVRSIALEEGVSMENLESIHGTGAEGRVTKKDMIAYLANRGGTTVITAKPTPANLTKPAIAYKV
ncbi:MAG: E3 binding domain-containing protein, partial [Flavobacteriales bacterium]